MRVLVLKLTSLEVKRQRLGLALVVQRLGKAGALPFATVFEPTPHIEIIPHARLESVQARGGVESLPGQLTKVTHEPRAENSRKDMGRSTAT